MNRIRLTMCITELDIGGAEKAFVQIATGLSERGWDVDVVSLRNCGPLGAQLLAAGIRVTALHCGGLGDLRAVGRLRKQLQSNRPQVLLTFLHQANLVGRIAGKWAGVDRIVSGIRVADRRLLISLPERMTQRLVDHYIAVSESVGATHCAISGIPSAKMSVIRNGVDVAAIEAAIPVNRAELGVSETDFAMLFVGRLTAQKAPLDLLRAFAAIPESLQNSAKLLFLGDGPLRAELESFVAKAGLQNRIRLLGWRPDVVSVMKACNLLVLPSHWEGLPNVILEAAAARIPVVAADVDGVRELIPDFAVGQRFPAGNSTALCQLLQQQMTHKIPHNATDKCSQHVTVKSLTWIDSVNSYDVLLRQVMASAAN